MGNHHSGSNSGHRPRKNVHWKSAECPSSPGKPELVPAGNPEEGVTLRWAPPRRDGGAALTGYRVECNRLGSELWVRTAPPLVARPELLLTGLEPGHHYQFRVAACNPVGVSAPGEVSDILTVSLDKAPVSVPRFIRGLADAECVENDKVEFRVYFEGAPAPSVSWFKDGYEIFSSRRTAIHTDGSSSTLILHQASLSDEGEIKCTATNRGGHAVSRARLALKAAPRIRLPRQYEDGLLYETEETIFLKVSVAGKPAPFVEWRHDGNLLLATDRVIISNTDKFSTLRIENASREDRGEYHINAKNSIGEDSASFLVTITARPDPPVSVSVTQNEDKSVSLSWISPNDDGGCQVGNYVIEYYRTGWDVWLKAATSRKLTATLFDLIEGSEYRFRVKAESPYGMSEPSEETRSVFIPGKVAESVFNPMDMLGDDILKTTYEKDYQTPQAVPRRKRHVSPVFDDVENVKKITLEIPAHFPPKKHKNGEPSLKQSDVLKHSTNEKVSYNLDVDKMKHGSSEFMLVLYPDKEDTVSEKRKSFQLDLEEAMSPPQLSLSAPELGYSFFPIRPLRNSVSSSELLHERAMSRFYQVIALKEAEKVKAKKEYISLATSIETKIDKLDEKEEKSKQFNKISFNSKDNDQARESNADNLGNDYVYSNESLNKDRSEETSSNFGDDYTASTVSTGDSDFTESDSLDEDVDGLRHRIEENATYHPSTEKTYRGGTQSSQAVEVLTKPAPLPDPNFIPKPILKKREPEIRHSPHKEAKNAAKSSKYSEPLINKVPLFKKFAKFPSEKHGFKEKKQNVTKKLEKSAESEPALPIQQKVAQAENEVCQDEGRSVIEHYGNIVKEYGSNKKPRRQLYTNTNDLKKAAANQIKGNGDISKVANNKQTPTKPALKKKDIPKNPEHKNPTASKSGPPQREQKSQISISDSQKKTTSPKQPASIETVSVSKSFSELNAEAENNVKTVINYIIDVFMLLVAFWLYLFKDERLALPFLGLTMYRQVNSAVRKKIPSFFTNKKSSSD